MLKSQSRSLAILLTGILLTHAAPSRAVDAPTTAPAGPRQESATGITHSFLALGGETYIMGDDGKVLWSYPRNTRDGFVRPDGNILLAVSKCKDYPGGAAVELTRDGKTVFEYKGTQAEVNTVQAIGEGHYMVAEAGPEPRLIELDQNGKVLAEVQLHATTDKVATQNFHLQTRMSRKLVNGNYLVPQLLDKVVREYAPDGKIVWQFKTPDEPKECWPFTAIRLDNGNTLIDCTHGLQSLEVDKDGKIVWQLTNADLPSPMLKDPCGAQRLPNGDTVITSYGQGTPGEVKLLEVTPEKKVVWTYRDDKKHGIHEFQVLDTNGKPLEGTPMK
jgi:outer membrane protein assembly factor BamB